MLTLQQTGGKWWIDDDGHATGPYDTKTEAESARRGLERWYKYENRPGYVCAGRKP